MATKRVIPPLVRIAPGEALAIESMFRLYDYKCTGRIPQHLAHKLTTALGFDFSVHALPLNGSLKEILLFLDMRIVDPEPALHAQLHSFTHLVAKKVDLNKKMKVTDDTDLEEGEKGDTFDENGEVMGVGVGGGGGRQRSQSDASQSSIVSKATDGGTPTKGGDKTESREKLMTADAINNFLVSIGRPPMSESQLELMLTAMLDYDDCNEKSGGSAGVLPEFFSREFTTFAKKSNALKNFK